MQDEQPPTIPDNQENEKPVNRQLTKKLSRKHKRFCDAYLLTLNATQAYKEVFKPKHPEYAYKIAYSLLKNQGIARYIDDALSQASDADYQPEAIKQGIRTLAMTATRDSDKLRAYELMSKISGLINDNTQNQVNVFTDDIMSLAKKRLADRKNLSNVNSIHEIEASVADSLSSKCSETRGLLQPELTQKLDVDSGSVGLTESVLSINTDKEADASDTIDSSDNGAGSDEGSPGGGDGRTPAHPSK